MYGALSGRWLEQRSVNAVRSHVYHEGLGEGLRSAGRVTFRRVALRVRIKKKE